jgi:uncharacterized DUF497 family protein
VRLTAAPDIAEWLGTRPLMEWDAGNSSGLSVEAAHDEARYLLLGVTSGGRHAALVFTRRGDKLRPISCRAMIKTEKEAYDAAT